jgi:RNA polymerase sigma factor (sigma-70 family)
MALRTAAALNELMRATDASVAATDRELIRRFADTGDQAAFATLFRRHSGMVLGVCRRTVTNLQDAEDACQATFLILARKAGSNRWHPSLANWLYGTARRVARNARIAAERRVRREGRAAVAEVRQTVDHMSGRDLLGVLDEELDKLPPRYREPLVLCYLQGLTRDEAATRLSVPAATVKSYLERGRKRLGKALTERGVLPGAGLLVMAASSSATACQLRLARTLLNSPPAEVTKLAEGAGVKGFGWLKWIGIGALISLATVWVARSGAIAIELAAPPALAVASAGASVNAEALAPERKNEATLKGRVLGPDGKPLSGAKLYLVGQPDQLSEVGISAEDGRFAIRVPKMCWTLHVLARAEGFGFDFVSLMRSDLGDEIELRLVKDQPIRGRVVDTQGKPVAGVQVWVPEVRVFENGSLDPFLTAWKWRNYQHGPPVGQKNFWWSAPMPLFPVTSDKEGRFTVTGAGAERYVVVRLSGAGIAATDIRVVNRAGFDPAPYNQASLDNIPKSGKQFAFRFVLSGPEPVVVAEAEKPIHGVVVAADTGKPRPGVVVRLEPESGKPFPVPLVARTDSAGAFKLHGANKRSKYTLKVDDDPDTGYMTTRTSGDDTPGYEPVGINIRVMKGVTVAGRIVDGGTGEGIPGFALAAVLGENPYVKDYPELQYGDLPYHEAADDGSFRLVTLPGPVLLMGGSGIRRESDGTYSPGYFKRVVADPKYPQYFQTVNSRLLFRIPVAGANPVQGCWCKVLDAKPGTAVVQQDIVLERAATLAVSIRDAAGKPLTGVLAAGTTPANFSPADRCKTDSCTVYDLQPGQRRLAVFFETQRNLAGTLHLTGDEKTPATVTLVPTGTVRGQVHGEDGNPLAGVEVGLVYKDRPAVEIRNLARPSREIVTKEDGSFTVDSVIPGLPFELEFRHLKKRFVPSTKDAEEKKAVSGETKELGTIVVKPVSMQ